MREKYTANMEIKKINRSKIYQLLLKNQGLSRQEIVLKLGLSLPTVTQNIEELIAEGLVEEFGFIGNTGGRRARSYRAVLNARVAIGLDVTKHHITCAAVDLSGNLIECIRIRRQFERTDEYNKILGSLVDEVVKKINIPPARVLGVGIGVPGLVTADNKRIFYGEILNFGGATSAEFGKYIPYPVSLHNDANAAGFAEIWSHDYLANSFYLMLSNNIGGSVLINGQIYSGENLRSGEIGHLKIVPNGKQCYCGQKGCFDAYCAATVLSNYTDGNLEKFFEKLRAKDPQAEKMWDEYLDNLAQAVSSLNILFDSTVILGGYVGEYIEDYLDDLKTRTAKLHPFNNDSAYLQACKYKKQAIAAGAALNYIDEFIASV